MWYCLNSSTSLLLKNWCIIFRGMSLNLIKKPRTSLIQYCSVRLHLHRSTEYQSSLCDGNAYPNYFWFAFYLIYSHSLSWVFDLTLLFQGDFERSNKLLPGQKTSVDAAIENWRMLQTWKSRNPSQTDEGIGSEFSGEGSGDSLSGGGPIKVKPRSLLLVF